MKSGSKFMDDTQSNAFEKSNKTIMESKSDESDSSSPSPKLWYYDPTWSQTEDPKEDYSKAFANTGKILIGRKSEGQAGRTMGCFHRVEKVDIVIAWLNYAECGQRWTEESAW
jgi:hypothetical protein